MMWRLNDMPTYSGTPSEIPAELYNLVRRVVIKSAEPIRFSFSEEPHISVIIDEDSWVCVNSDNHDMPIAAWVDFEAAHRSDLHSPIHCTKNYYHFAAGRVAAQALDEIEYYLGEHFTPAPFCRLQQGQRKKRIWHTANRARLSCV